MNEANLDPYDPRYVLWTCALQLTFDYRQTFCVNIHPPSEEALHMGVFGRKIVFLVGMQFASIIAILENVIAGRQESTVYVTDLCY